MSRKPVFTVCFVASVLLFGGFQLWADGPNGSNGAKLAAVEVLPVVNGFDAAVVANQANVEHDLGDGLRAKIKQSAPLDLSSFELTVHNTSDKRVECAVDIQMAVSEQSFRSRVPTPPTVNRRTDKMVVWLDPGETKSKKVQTKVAEAAMGTGAQVTLKRAGTVIPSALTMGLTPDEPTLNIRPVRRERLELPKELPRKAVLLPEVMGNAKAAR